MDKERLLWASKAVELSEHKHFLLLENRICYYDAENLNGVMLPSDTAERFAQTLVGMPIYAKYMVNAEGAPSFGGHEAYVDADGNIAFDTEAIGVHISATIRNDVVEVDGTVKELPCLFAVQKIWTRNKNVSAAVRRLFAEDRLYNSWEIEVDSYIFESGVKKLTSYSFIGNCFLGVDNDNYPAYGPSAKVVSLSALKEDSGTLMVANAMVKDLTEQENAKGGENMENETVSNIDQIVVANTDSEIEQTDDAETNTDMEDRQADPLDQEKDENEDVDALPDTEDAPAADESSETNSEEIPIAKEDEAPEGTEATEPGTENSGTEEISKATVDTLCEKIAELTSALNEARANIAALSVYKEKVEAAERDVKIAELTAYVQDAACFTASEINGAEIQGLIAELNKPALAGMIADRQVERMREEKNKASTPATKKVGVTISSVLDGFPSDTNNLHAVMNDFFSK